MKSGICKFSIVLLAMVMAVGAGAMTPRSKEFSKVIIKEFPLNSNQELEINNQYGLVKVESWDQEAVKIKIEIVVDTDSEESAQEIYKRIKFGFEQSSRGVACTTQIESSNSGFWNWWGSDCNSEYSINFDVKMPARSHLALANKYGDCNVNNLSNSASYRVKYGNIVQFGEMESVEMSLGYGKAKIEATRELVASLEYATFKMNSAEICEVNSKYSNVYIQDAGELVCNTKYDDYQLGLIGTLRNSGKYDDFQIEEVSDIAINTMYADLEIGRLHQFADLKFKYGEVDIKEVYDSFKKIQIEGQYADFKINTSEVKSFSVNVDGQYADVDCKRNLSDVEEVKDGTHHRLVGYVSDKSSGGDITARVTYGSVRIK